MHSCRLESQPGPKGRGLSALLVSLIALACGDDRLGVLPPVGGQRAAYLSLVRCKAAACVPPRIALVAGFGLDNLASSFWHRVPLSRCCSNYSRKRMTRTSRPREAGSRNCHRPEKASSRYRNFVG